MAETLSGAAARKHRHLKRRAAFGRRSRRATPGVVLTYAFPGLPSLLLAALFLIGAVLYAAFQQPYSDRQESAPLTSMDFWIERITVKSAYLAWAAIPFTRITPTDFDIKGFHRGPVNAVAVSTDGTFVLSGGDDATVRAWDLAGKELFTLEEHSGRVLAVAISRNNELLATGGADGKIQLWNAKGKLLHTYGGHSDWVRSLTFSNDGNLLLSSGDDRSVRVWGVQDRTEQRKIETEDNLYFYSAAFLDNNQNIVASDDEGRIHIWDRRGTKLADINAHERTVQPVSANGSGDIFVSGRNDGSVRLWKSDGTAIKTILESGSPIISVHLSSDGERILAGDRDGIVRVWDKEGNLLQTYGEHTGRISSVTYHATSRQVVSSSRDGTIRVWGPQGALRATMVGHRGYAPAVAFSPDDNQIASGGIDGFIRLWDRDGNETGYLEAHRGPVTSVAYSPDGTLIASGGVDGRVGVWPLTAAKAGKTFDHGDDVLTVSFSRDGRWVASGGTDGNIRLWEVQGQRSRLLEGHTDWVRSVAFSPKHDLIASASDDETVRLWSYEDEQQRNQIDGHSDWVRTVAFSPDGEKVISAGDDRTINIFDVNTSEIQSLQGHDGLILSVAASPQGNRLVSAGQDGSLRLWDPEGGELARIESDTGSIQSTAFSSHGDEFLSSDTSGRIRLFEHQTANTFPAIWTYPVGFAALLLLALFANAYIKTYRIIATPPAPSAVSAFLESDGPLDDPNNAGSGLRTLCQRVSNFIQSPATTTPLSIALVGAWGAGKSSAMQLLRRDLASQKYPTVWFNAWHHQSESHLFAALMEKIRLDAVPSFFTWDFFQPRNLAVRVRLLAQRVSANPWRYIFAAFLFTLLGALTYYAYHRIDMSGPSTDDPATKVFLSAGGLGAVVLLYTTLRDLLMPFKEKPAALYQTTKGLFSTARFEDRLSFRHRFGAAFKEVCAAFADRRLTILIDDLDRCKPNKVVDVLEAVNFLTSNGDCFVILGISEEPVKDAVGLSFENQAAERALAEDSRVGTRNSAAGVPQAPAGSQDDQGYAARERYAQHYLEKLINLRIPVPPFDPIALKEWLEQGEGEAEPASLTFRERIAAFRDRGRLILHRLFRQISVTLFIVLACWAALQIAGPVFESLMELPPRTAGAPGEQDPKGEDKKTVNLQNSSGHNPNPGTSQGTAEVAAHDAASIQGFVRPPRADQEAPAQAELPAVENIPESLKKVPPAGSSQPPQADFLQTLTGTIAISDNVDWKNWFYICVVVLSLGVGAGALDPRLRSVISNKIKPREPTDTEKFRTALELWLPLVLHYRGSPRAIKRFCNRMRYLTAYIPQARVKSLKNLILLGALEEIGELKPGHSFRDWSKKNGLRNGPRKALKNAAVLGLTDDLLDEVTEDDWGFYWDLAGSARFSG